MLTRTGKYLGACLLGACLLGACIGASAMWYAQRDELERAKKRFTTQLAETRVAAKKAASERMALVPVDNSPPRPPKVAAQPPAITPVQSNVAPKVGSSAEAENAAAEYASRRVLSTAKIDKQYGGYFEQLRGNGRDPGKLRGMLIDRDMIASDILSAARAQGVDLRNSASMRAVSDLVSRSSRDFTGQMSQALGDDYKELLKWQSNMPEERAVIQFAQSLDGTPFALTDEQRQSLAKVLQTTRDETGRRVVMPSRDPSDGPVRVIPQTVVDPMRAVLNAQQMQSLLTYIQNQVDLNMGGPLSRPLPR